ncbi:hypothetical protein [Hahella chejuensis]|uniref:hypothetical protein n=1 Tax=Hahella chejuensis TaxID=158327 RepID=UPI00130521D9|nr:hypothetical protein [Hahella chejuensis]
MPKRKYNPQWIRSSKPDESGQYLVAVDSVLGMGAIMCYEYSVINGWSHKDPNETIFAYMKLEDAVSALPYPWDDDE